MTWMDPDGVRALAGSLCGVREALVPVGVVNPSGDLGGADVDAACSEFGSQLDQVLLTLAGEADFLQSAATSAAAAWVAAEAANTRRWSQPAGAR